MAFNRPNKFTNIPSVAQDNPDYTFVDEAGNQTASEDLEATQYGDAQAAAKPVASEYANQKVQGAHGEAANVDPRLGMNKRGEWDAQKMQALFPELVYPKFTEKVEGAVDEFGAKRVVEMLNEPMKQPAVQMDNTPVFSPQGRDAFESEVIRQMPFNPYTFDPVKVATQRFQAGLPQLFDQVFQGRYAWKDLPNLSKADEQFFANEKKQFYKHQEDVAKSEKAQAVKQLQWAMGRFDYQEKSQKYKERQAAMGNKPRLVNALNPAGQTEIFEYDPKTLNFHPTGQIVKEAPDPKMPRMKTIEGPDYLKVINKLSTVHATGKSGDLVESLMSGIREREAKEKGIPYVPSAPVTLNEDQLKIADAALSFLEKYENTKITWESKFPGVPRPSKKTAAEPPPVSPGPGTKPAGSTPGAANTINPPGKGVPISFSENPIVEPGSQNIEIGKPASDFAVAPPEDRGVKEKTTVQRPAPLEDIKKVAPDTVKFLSNRDVNELIRARDAAKLKGVDTVVLDKLKIKMSDLEIFLNYKNYADTGDGSKKKVTTSDDLHREDGSLKGPGFLGSLKHAGGKTSTELSIGVEFDGKEMEIPSLVPTLTEDEIDYLLKGGKPTNEITKKAVAHARERIKQGKSPFKEGVFKE